MGQNKIINNNKLSNNNMGQDMGQRDKVKAKALQNIGLFHSLSHASQISGTKETRFNSGFEVSCPTVPLVPPKHDGTRFEELLRKIEARVEERPQGSALVFDPPLECSELFT